MIFGGGLQNTINIEIFYKNINIEEKSMGQSMEWYFQEELKEVMFFSSHH